LKINVLILTGYGINAEKELSWAFEKAGGNVEIIHLEDLIENKGKLNNFQILAFPGGFSFGDHIASGKVFANIIKYNLFDEVRAFIEKDKLIIGICNGFQIITKLGIVPNIEGNYKQNVSLTENDSGHFENRWVWVRNEQSISPWLNEIEALYLPVRHGEGKFIVREEETLNYFKKNKLTALKYFKPDSFEVTYPFNPNGSVENIAGITNIKGNVFGLMPHPEAFIFPENHPHWTEGNVEKNTGLKIFENGINYFK
jgi:phosphoribosylformylglycinamidine synthase subunit PurQ / glutaminase